MRYLVPDAALEEIYARGLYGAARPPRHRLFGRPLPPLPMDQSASEAEEKDAVKVNAEVPPRPLVW